MKETWSVPGTDTNVAVADAGFIAGNTGGCDHTPPVRTHPMKMKKNTGTSHPPSVHLEYSHSSSSGKINSTRSYLRHQQYYTRTPTVFTSDDATSEDEEEEVKHLSFWEHHKESRSLSSRNSYPIKNHPQELAKSAFFTSDDFSRDNAEEEVLRSSSSIQPKISWSMLSLKNSPGFDKLDQLYGRDKLSSVARSRNQHESKAPLQHAPVDLRMMEKGNSFASNKTVEHVYKSIQEQCNRILHLLDRNRTELGNKCISSVQCEITEDQGLGTTSDEKHERSQGRKYWN